jgi:shikimate kinase
MHAHADHCIALVGFRGCGKSSLGARLAVELVRPFFDLDREIELAQGRPIRELFESAGEASFRALEAETLAGVVARPGIVLAPGGGAILPSASRTLLRARTFCVFLDVAVDEIECRLAGGGGRPRLTGLPFAEEARALMRLRRPLYLETAHAVVAVASGETFEQTFERVRALVPVGN